jgi:hypothetical protein
MSRGNILYLLGRFGNMEYFIDCHINPNCKIVAANFGLRQYILLAMGMAVRAESLLSFA